MDSKCWEVSENASRRPKNWRSKKPIETANVAYDGQSGPNVELLLSNIDNELQTFPDNQSLLMDPNIWIGDTAATVHMTPHEEGIVNMKNTGGGITVGNGEVMVAKKAGDIPCELCDRHGNMVHSGRITDVALIKSCPLNLFSVTKMMKEGWKLSGDGENGITLSKGGNNLSFDIPVATPRGVVYAMYVRRSEIANPALVTTMTVEKAHCLLGHQSEDTTRKIAKYIGWEITKGALKPCLSCSIGKAKQKNTVKDSDHVKSNSLVNDFLQILRLFALLKG
jgi:hypothetical protein